MMFLLVRIIRATGGDVGVPVWMHVDKELDTNKKSQLLIYKELGWECLSLADSNNFKYTLYILHALILSLTHQKIGHLIKIWLICGVF